MKLKIILALTVFVMSLIMASCSSGTTEKIDVEKYRESQRQKMEEKGYDPEKAKEGRKSIFPKIKEESN